MKSNAAPGRNHNDSLGLTYGHVKPFIAGGHLCRNWRDQRPVPPLSEYEAYAATLDCRCRIDPVKYRRITILTRNATPLAEAARLAGYTGVPHGYRKLPEHLR